GRFKKPEHQPQQAQEPRVPKSFPCDACEEPSFGNRCQACGGHVCPDHELAPDSWCTLCVQDWHKHVEHSRLTRRQRLTFVGASGLLSLLAGFGASQGEVTSGISVGVGAALTLALAWTVALVAGRLQRRRSFLRERPNREQTEARRVTLEAEPEVGPSSAEFNTAMDIALPELAAEPALALEAAPDDPTQAPKATAEPPGSEAPQAEAGAETAAVEEAAVESTAAEQADQDATTEAAAPDETDIVVTAIEEAAEEDDSPSISWLPGAMELRVSTPSPSISFAPVSNAGTWGEAEEHESTPSEAPESLPEPADLDGQPASNVSLSNPNLRNLPDSFPSDVERANAFSEAASSLSMGAAARLSVRPNRVQQRDDCSAAPLSAACFREVLTACDGGVPTCAAPPAVLGGVTEADDGDAELRPPPTPSVLRHAC
ncbi:MAG: hypothetical protein KC492_14915, partial [Myxococcales bacterium]|nr:hypothetical protein [Myxococcales bacterium]